MSNKRDIIQTLVDAFPTEPVCVADALSDGRFFLDKKYDALSRHLGDLFWLPVSHAYVAFCYAYSALFGIPDFTREALTRQPDRFSEKRLALTIRSTSGFVLDGFGYDRRTERYRKDIYWPGACYSQCACGESQTQQGADFQSGDGVFWLSSHPRGGMALSTLQRCGFFSRTSAAL